MVLALLFPVVVLLLFAVAIGAGCAYWAAGSLGRRVGFGCLGSAGLVLLPLAVIVMPLFFIR